MENDNKIQDDTTPSRKGAPVWVSVLCVLLGIACLLLFMNNLTLDNRINALSKENGKLTEGGISSVIDSILSSMKKEVSVIVVMDKSNGLHVNMDKNLYQSIIESNFRKEGYVIKEKDACIRVVLGLTCLKIDENMFCYVIQMDAVSSRPMTNNVKKGYVTLSANMSLRYAGFQSGYESGVREKINDFLITVLNDLEKSVTWEKSESK